MASNYVVLGNKLAINLSLVLRFIKKDVIDKEYPYRIEFFSPNNQMFFVSFAEMQDRDQEFDRITKTVSAVNSW